MTGKPRLNFNVLFIVIALLAVTAVFSACSSKKNTAARRQYTAFITRYNIYYNGDTHFKETLSDMESKYEDDYSSRMLFMHPVEAKNDPLAPQPSGDFTRSIEKAQKAIQLRSIKQRPAKKSGKSRDEAYKEWMKRDEYNPFLHNAWMMMGRSQYYNGDFLGAASTFFYISRHFTWLPNTVTEAKLWQARSYVSLGWLFEAEMILTRIKPEELVNKTLKGLYDFSMADWYLKSEDYAAAVPYLTGAIKAADGAQRTRLYFLLGQVYTRLDRKADAYEAYKKAGSGASASYRTKFNARIKQSEVYEGDDITPEVKALRRMTRYDRNKEYLDQIYYAIGNLYLSRGDTTEAISNYRLAAEKSSRSGIDKAITQIRLGGLYFDRGEYELAQPCYAEAVPMLPKTYPDYKELVKRSDVLDELALYSENVNLQDSLLRLSNMTPEQQLEVINKIIAELKKKEKEEAEAAAREEYLAQREAEGSAFGNNAAVPNSFTINSDNSWYFYNAATRNAGRSEFQRRWGSRKLEDDWRRRNKASFNLDFGDSGDNSEDEDDESGESSENVEDARNAEPAKADDPHYPEYYLAQIPKDDAERATANDIIQEGLYNMGVILKDKLDDYSAAEREFDRLLDDYPDNIYRLDVYYNLYLMYMRAGDPVRAERYRQLILSDFPDSKYGIALLDPDYIDNLRKMDEREAQLYDKAYNDYLNNRNSEVHDAYRIMSEQFPMSKIMPKFMFIDALAYVTEKQPEKFAEVIRNLLERYPDTDLTPTVASWLKGIQQGRKLHSPENGNIRGMIWDLRLGNDSIAVDTPIEFDLNPDNSQLLVMVFDAADVPTNELLFEIARHNFRSFVVKDFDLEQMNFGRLGMIVIRGFANLNELNHYRQVMADSPDFKLPRGVRPVAISSANFEKMLNEGRTFDDYFRYLEEQNYVDAQAGLLEPEEIKTLEEADAAAAAEAVSDESDESDKSDLTDQSEVKPVESRPAATAKEQNSEKPAENQKTEKPAPKVNNQPPAIEPGSEGDDPLLED
ncbi:MAG: tetratricopeptide repeat protein [Muribaculaceae bacterium]|nr:tetratricopeptide repeat protein [Muribaculaceae bacterium]